MLNELEIRLSRERQTLERLKYSGLVKDEEYNFAKEILERHKGEL